MKLTNIMIGLFLGTGLVSSCQSEIEEGEGYGYLQLSSVDVNKNVTTRADVTSSEAIAVDILDASAAVVKHADDWTELNDVLLPVATYTIKAYSADKDKEAQGFEAAPYYEGEKEVAIEANQAKAVNITCKLAQAMVSINCSESFKSTFSTYSCSIEGTDLSIPFVKDEARAAYVKAGQPLTVKVGFGNGKSFTQQITEKAEAAYYYKVNLDITEGNASFDITVDQTIHQYEVLVKVPSTQDETTVTTGIATTDISNDVSKVWGQFAYLSGTCDLQDATSPVQFAYKKKADSEWKTVEATHGEGNEYSAKVSPLDFGTEYEYHILCGDKTGETYSFTTESFEAIPNLGFEDWSQKGKNWYPNTDASNSYWATGNEGVTMGGSSNSTGVSDSHTGLAARLETVEVKVLIVKVKAAGNLFIGSYKTNVSDPASSVTFGKPYAGARPTKLSGYFKYQPGATMSSGSVPADRTLTADECDIYIQLWSGDVTIGEGHFITNKTVSEYTRFEIPVEYTVTNKRPDKITIVATSSRYGGYFDGMSVVGQLAIGSTLWVDDFELSYY